MNKYISEFPGCFECQCSPTHLGVPFNRRAFTADLRLQNCSVQLGTNYTHNSNAITNLHTVKKLIPKCANNNLFSNIHTYLVESESRYSRSFFEAKIFSEDSKSYFNHIFCRILTIVRSIFLTRVIYHHNAAWREGT